MISNEIKKLEEMKDLQFKLKTEIKEKALALRLAKVRIRIQKQYILKLKKEMANETQETKPAN